MGSRQQFSYARANFGVNEEDDDRVIFGVNEYEVIEDISPSGYFSSWVFASELIIEVHGRQVRRRRFSRIYRFFNYRVTPQLLHEVAVRRMETYAGMSRPRDISEGPPPLTRQSGSLMRYYWSGATRRPRDGQLGSSHGNITESDDVKGAQGSTFISPSSRHSKPLGGGNCHKTKKGPTQQRWVPKAQPVAGASSQPPVPAAGLPVIDPPQESDMNMYDKLGMVTPKTKVRFAVTSVIKDVPAASEYIPSVTFSANRWDFAGVTHVVNESITHTEVCSDELRRDLEGVCESKRWRVKWNEHLERSYKQKLSRAGWVAGLIVMRRVVAERKLIAAKERKIELEVEREDALLSKYTESKKMCKMPFYSPSWFSGAWLNPLVYNDRFAMMAGFRTHRQVDAHGEVIRALIDYSAGFKADEKLADVLRKKLTNDAAGSPLIEKVPPKHREWARINYPIIVCQYWKLVKEHDKSHLPSTTGIVDGCLNVIGLLLLTLAYSVYGMWTWIWSLTTETMAAFAESTLEERRLSSKVSSTLHELGGLGLKVGVLITLSSMGWLPIWLSTGIVISLCAILLIDFSMTKLVFLIFMFISGIGLQTLTFFATTVFWLATWICQHPLITGPILCVMSLISFMLSDPLGCLLTKELMRCHSWVSKKVISGKLSVHTWLIRISSRWRSPDLESGVEVPLISGQHDHSVVETGSRSSSR